MAIATINGQVYAVRLPTGGAVPGAPSEWDTMLDVLGEKNPIYHAKKLLSWCQDIEKTDPGCRVYRGQISPRHWNAISSARYEYAHIGYRPLLEPLEPKTLRPAPHVLANIPEGEVLTMGSFYVDGKAKPLPLDPDWCGDIPQYLGQGRLSIGDTDPDPKNHLRFIKIKHFLICDRNLMTGISWDVLDSFGLVYGQQPSLDSVITRAKEGSVQARNPKEQASLVKESTRV